MTKDQQKKTEYKDWLISELLPELPKLNPLLLWRVLDYRILQARIFFIVKVKK